MLQIKEFIYSILRRWKLFLIIAVICAVIGAGFYSARFFLSPETDTEIADTDHITKWTEAEEYYVAKLKYIGIGNEITTSKVVLDAYSAHLYGVSFKQHLIDNCFDDKETIKSVSNLISIHAGGLENCLIVECISYDESRCQEISAVIENYIAQLSDKMTEGLGNHTLFLVDSSLGEGFEVYSDQWFTNVKTFYASEITQVEETTIFSLKSLIVFALLFAIVGCFLSIVFAVIADTIKDRTYNTKQLGSEKSPEHLGDFSFMNLKCKIDVFLYKAFIDRSDFSPKGMANLVNFKLSNTRPCKNFVLTGNGTQEELSNMKDLLAENPHCLNITVKELPSEDAETLSQWNTEEEIIYVVHRFKDNAGIIKERIKLYENIGLKIAGILFI